MPIVLNDTHCPYCQIKIDTGVLWVSHLWQDHQDKLEHITELTFLCLSYTLRTKKLPALMMPPEEFDDIMDMGLTDDDEIQRELEIRRTKFYDDDGNEVLFDPSGTDEHFKPGGKFHNWVKDPFGKHDDDETPGLKKKILNTFFDITGDAFKKLKDKGLIPDFPITKTDFDKVIRLEVSNDQKKELLKEKRIRFYDEKQNEVDYDQDNREHRKRAMKIIADDLNSEKKDYDEKQKDSKNKNDDSKNSDKKKEK